MQSLYKLYSNKKNFNLHKRGDLLLRILKQNKSRDTEN